MPFRRAAVAALAVLTVAGCGSGTETPAAAPPAEDTALPVVASTNVYGSIVEAVGGDHVNVDSLIDDPAADPHSYESTPADAAAVAKARLVVVNGGGYDDFLTRLVESSGTNPTVVDVAAVSGLVPAEEQHAEGEPEGEEHGHEHGEFNEHFWYSLPTVQKVATQIAADLGAADPADAAEFTANAEAFNARVAELITRAEAIGKAQPGARIAVTEPVPGHLVETAGLTDVTPHEFTEAIEEDTDPPAAVLQETLALFSGDPVRALVVNAQTETPSTDQVREAAQTAGVPVVEMTETLPEGSGDYVDWMGGQIDALAGALGTPSPGS
ncbi:zinc/manganese transport system substrate-binding protein [Pseudonocardia hierapolitana]|uniref:Zinc/manganese transport system substrate-binding protein n=1 Tax=Pseudonocardia hierapolitana TaxID=1128676 RepID=A0A561SSR1_9PSEU|nr:zinc ABC transporter substrate-binding protein [Pseudonocardia hierapolitana]TWF77906.1 zinc/manganese transport system substrate-binding protein [Pseudonocardia hierapolitana]